MRHTWRWFGPVDKVTVQDAAQAGAEGIVSALHHIATGDVWPVDEIDKRHEAIKAGGLYWDVVESVPVSEEIKTQTGDWKNHIANWQETLRRLSATGIRTVCYNFMPVLDWTRTDLRWETKHGAKAMRFDLSDFAAFDIHILKRPDAKADYPEWLIEEAAKRFADMPDTKIAALGRNIGAGLPGSADGYTLSQLLEKLRSYHGINREKLQQNLIDFLSEVTPVAEEVGINICAHGDDPHGRCSACRVFFQRSPTTPICSRKSTAGPMALRSAPARSARGRITTCPSSPAVLQTASISCICATSRATRTPCPAPSSRTSIWKVERIWSPLSQHFCRKNPAVARRAVQTTPFRCGPTMARKSLMT